MSKDSSQGTGPARPTPQRLPTPKPKTAAAVKAQVQGAVDKRFAETFAKPRPAQVVPGSHDPRDFRVG